MMQQYILPKQRDTVLANINTSLRPVTSPNSDATSQSTSVVVNNNTTGSNVPLKGSGINRMSLVSELIMKEKLQKCSSSTGSETSEDGGLPPRSVGTKNLSELGKDVGAQNQQNSSQHNVRYLPLNMS